MEDLPTASPSFNFRRTQSCRVAPRSNGTIKRGGKCIRSKSTRRGTLGSISLLSFSQKQSLTVSWRLMRPVAASLFRKILLELEVACPKVKQIFYKAALVDAFNKDEDNSATLDVHIRLIIKFFDDILCLLEDESECINRMKSVGKAHAVLSRSCNFSSDIWERLGEITMEKMCTHEMIQKTREASRAWRTLLACVIDEMRGGFEEAVRIRRKSSSVEQLDDDVEPEDLNTKLRQLRMDYDQSVSYQ